MCSSFKTTYKSRPPYVHESIPKLRDSLDNIEEGDTTPDIDHVDVDFMSIMISSYHRISKTQIHTFV